MRSSKTSSAVTPRERYIMRKRVKKGNTEDVASPLASETTNINLHYSLLEDIMNKKTEGDKSITVL